MSKRGREAAALVGRQLPDAVGALDLVLCSDAVRTRETLELALARFAVRPPCLIEPGLYLADCYKLLARLRRLDETFGNVLVIGHNPGIQELALALAEAARRLDVAVDERQRGQGSHKGDREQRPEHGYSVRKPNMPVGR